MCVKYSIRNLHLTLSITSEFRENPRGKDRTFLMETNKILRALVPRNSDAIWTESGHSCLGAGAPGCRQAPATPLLGPESAFGIPKCVARDAIKNWTENQHYNAWRNLPGHRHKLFIGQPCKKRADNLLKLSRRQLKTVVVIRNRTCSCKRAPVYHGPVWWRSNLQIL
jgi:hypothetical protein